MPIFDAEAEKLRKLNLKKLEDKRVAFAQKLEGLNFKPEKMLFCSTEDGRFVGLARHEGKLAIVTSPVFGSDDDFSFEVQDTPNYEVEDIYEKGTGLNGAFGFGKKGARGDKYWFHLQDGSTVALEAVAGRTSFLQTNLKNNPLLKTKRRRGDANIVWDFAPIEVDKVEKIRKAMQEYFLV